MAVGLSSIKTEIGIELKVNKVRLASMCFVFFEFQDNKA